MSDDESRPVDPDRAAILARRQHFIALALTGLATTACTKGTPQPCLDVPPPGEESQAPPEPCLKMAPPDDTTGDEETTGSDPVPPEPCLKMAPPPSEETDTGDETGGETGDETGEPQQAPPKPCLRQAAPRPCLKKARP